MNKRALLAAALLLPACAAAIDMPFVNSFAQRFRGPVIRVRMIEGVKDRVVDGKLHLRLNDFLQLVLKNNTEINIMRLDEMVAQDAILASRASLDPRLTFNFNTSRSQSAQFNQTAGADTLSSLSHYGQLNYSQTLESGQTFTVGMSTNRNSSNSRFNTFNPSYQGSLNLGLTQPLLQNRSSVQIKAPLAIARTRLLITTDQTAQRIAQNIESAARQYWDAVQTRDNIKVQQFAVDLAQKSYERDKLALDLGALSELEIYQSQSQVAQRKLGVIQAQYAYRDALDGLRRLIGADLDPATRDAEIVLDDDPAALPAVSPLRPLEEAVAGALANRPELVALRRQYGIDDLNIRVARNSLMPRLDLGLNFSGSGLGGNQIPVQSPLGGFTEFIPGGMGDAMHQIFSFQSPAYGFSLQMTFPVRSSAAEASLADSMVSKARNQYTERQLNQQIIQEVKAATNQLEMAAAQIEAAKQARDLAQKNVDAQQQKYEIGGITAFELLDAQNRLATVESSLVTAYATHQKAIIAYRRATWTLLSDLNLVIR